MFTPAEMRKLLKPQREQVAKPQMCCTASRTDYVRWFRAFADASVESEFTDSEVVTIVSRCVDWSTNVEMVEAAVELAGKVVVGRGQGKTTHKLDPQYEMYASRYTVPANFGNTNPHES